MAIEIVVPRLGWTMEEGIFGEWLKQEGDAIAVGDLLYTMETDKATQEVEALEAGILHIAPDGPRMGQIVPVGARLGYLLQPGESFPPSEAAPSGLPIGTNMPAAATTAPTPVAAPSGIPATLRATPASSPRARRVARELGIDWTTLTGSGSRGRIIERDVRAAQQAAPSGRPATPEVRATPVARRMAEDAGIDLATVTPQKTGGRVQREDVEAAIAARAVAQAPAPATPPSAAPVMDAPPLAVPVTDAGETQPTDRVRRLIAQRMGESSQQTAAVTLVTEADATDLVALREQLKAAYTALDWPVPTYNDLLIKLTATALLEHPHLNATWHDTEITLYRGVHMGVAVDATSINLGEAPPPVGLLVPVIRNAHSKSVRQIAAESRDLAERARSRRLTPDELQGGSFTLTNLGMYGIDAFTPIINLPQTAILGVGRIQAKPAVVDGQIVPRQLVTLSLTFDHRAVDGGPAARFLNRVRTAIEAPTPWLLA